MILGTRAGRVGYLESMHIVYAKAAIPDAFDRALFLAGPTPRSADVPSWRPEALSILEEIGYDGVVFVPEEAGGGFDGAYVDQVTWEHRGLALSDCIVFWIPRDLATMPAFTTNIEWGMWHASGKVVLGAPRGAPKMRYLHHTAAAHQVPVATTLRDTLALAVARVSPGARRTAGERGVPLHIWTAPPFRQWYDAQIDAGNRLDGARVGWEHRSGPEHRLFCWVIHADLHVTAEDRNKRGEFVFTRPDVTAVLAYHPGPTPGQTRIVLVREFRSNAATPDGFVHELPGGSSPSAELGPSAVAAEELVEETGLALDVARFTLHPSRQCAATLVSYRAHLCSVCLTADEIAYFEAEAASGTRHGAHDSERTYVEVRTLDAVLASSDVDWIHVGMIVSVLTGDRIRATG